MNKRWSFAVRHVSRKRSVDLYWLYDRLDPMIQIKYVHTTCHLAQNSYYKISHRTQMDANWHCWWTSCLAPLLLKTNCQFLLQLWIVYVTAWVNEPVNLPQHRLARSNIQFIVQDWLQETIAIRMPTWTYHTLLPPEDQVGGDSTRESLCQQDSERDNKTTSEASSSGKLEGWGASNIARPVAAEDLASEKKVTFIQILMEEYIRKKILDIISSCRPRRSTKFSIKYWTVSVKYVVKVSPQSSIFPAQRCDLKPIYERLLVGPLDYKGSPKTLR